MVTVYVWNPLVLTKAPLVGHASMHIGREYVSWWPEQAGRVFNTSPYRQRTLEQDIEAEANRQPDYRIAIDGLDTARMLDWWASVGLQANGMLLHGPLQAYDLIERNCSTVVAAGLRVGGGDKHAAWWNSWNIVWTPRDVMRYAEDIRRSLLKGR
ncbi:MAG: hypothetical protein KF838_00975 [Phycisphaeraceae bacterium]|nr:MAG: hypothetical protein KF838_00975 [Phycisphaeraceae bacterium]